MRKLLSFLFIAFLSINAVLAAEQQTNQQLPAQKSMNAQEIRKAREAAFEARLNLTEEQKVLARASRQKSFERIKPLVDQIKAKKQEAEMIKRSRLAVQMQEEKLAVIDAELKELEKKVMAIRKENMKAFETILTKEQKKIFRSMIKEGNANRKKQSMSK